MKRLVAWAMWFLKNYGWTAWLGGILGAAQWPVWQWQWWLAFIPMLLLVGWRCDWSAATPLPEVNPDEEAA